MICSDQTEELRPLDRLIRSLERSLGDPPSFNFNPSRRDLDVLIFLFFFKMETSHSRSLERFAVPLDEQYHLGPTGRSKAKKSQ